MRYHIDTQKMKECTIITPIPTSGSDIDRMHIGITDIINNTIIQNADADDDDDDEDEIPNTEKAIVPNNMTILPTNETIDDDNKNGAPNNKDSENSQINQESAQEAVYVGKKRERECKEQNSIFPVYAHEI